MMLNDRIVVKTTIDIHLPYETVFKFFSDPFYMRHLTRVVGSCDTLYENGNKKVIQIVMNLLPPVTNR
jgi:hypothetical protein